MAPFLPFSAERLWKMLNIPGSLDDQRWHNLAQLRLPEGHSLGEREILFNKIEDSVIAAQVARLHAMKSP
jgi:methionyl-tRNA synthetase